MKNKCEFGFSWIKLNTTLNCKSTIFLQMEILDTFKATVSYKRKCCLDPWVRPRINRSMAEEECRHSKGLPSLNVKRLET